MHQLFTGKRSLATWLTLALLSLAVSGVFSLAAADRDSLVLSPADSGSLSDIGSDASPSFATPPLYSRTVEWWPYTTGPYYGDRSKRLSGLDVIRTPVGEFRIGESLDIPAELTGSTRAIAEGHAQYFLVQFAGQDAGASRSVIESLGARVAFTLPVNAAVVRLDPTNYDRVASSPAISFIEPYHPAFRIAPSVGKVRQLTAQAAASTVFALRVDLFPGEPEAPVVQALQQLGGEILGVAGSLDHRSISVRLSAAQIPQVARMEPVAVISEIGPTFLHEVRGSLFVQSPTGLRGDFPYWEAGVDGDGQILEVTDSGLSVDAGDFSNTRGDSGWDGSGGNAGPNVIANHRKVVAYRTAASIGAGGGGDLFACDSSASGGFTHGQVVAGTALGNGTRDEVPAPPNPSPSPSYGAEGGFYNDNNSDGEFDEVNDDGFDGVAKGAKVVFVDASTDCGSSGIQAANLNDTITTTWTNYGANIHNFSFGSQAAEGSPPNYAGGGSDIDAAINANPINFVATSAGNDGTPDDGKFDIGIQSNQASCKNCVVVGGSSGVNGGGVSATSGGYGPGRRVLNLLFAEFTDNACRSEDAGEATPENQTGPATCEDSGLKGGTSFSSPNLAGAAALVRDYFAKGFYPDGTDQNSNNSSEQHPAITGALVKAVLIAGAQPITTGRNLMPEDRFNYFWGYGRIQLNNSLPLADFPNKSISGLIVHDSPGIDLDGDGTIDEVSNLSFPSGALPATPQTYDAEIDVLDDTEDLVVVLVWNAPSSGTGEIANDLDLRVRYCGTDGDCATQDGDIVWAGNIFSEDYNRDGTLDGDINGNGQTDGYHYSIERQGINDSWKDDVNNTEAVFIPTLDSGPDKDGDGTIDVATIKPGRYQITIERPAGGGSDAVLYAVAITGPVAAGSSVRFDANPLTCNADVSVQVSETDDPADTQCNAASCPPSVIASRTIVEVVDDLGNVVDTESNLTFALASPDPGTLRFESNRLPLSADVDPPVAEDGILSVQNGYSLRAVYQDTDTDRRSVSAVDCEVNVEVLFIPQVGRDFPFLLVGGCDDDKYLDPGESFAMQLNYFTIGETDIVEGQASFRAVTPYPDGTDPQTIANDPCRLNRPDSPYIKIENPQTQIDLLPPQTLEAVNFTLEVVGTPPGREQVEFVFGVSSPKTGQPVENCVTYTLLMSASDETHRFITDCPTGCTADFDVNADERADDSVPGNPFDPFDLLNRGEDETAIVYEDLTDTSFRSVDADGDGSPDCPNCGNDALSFTGPWNFDVDDEGFRTGISPRSQLNAFTSSITNWGEDQNFDGLFQPEEDSLIDGVPGQLDQNWSLLGGCGFVTSSGNNRGIWHTGTIGQWLPSHETISCRPDDSICEQYDFYGGAFGFGADYWLNYLRTPTIHPVRIGTDVDGFAWYPQIRDWAWNAQVDMDGQDTLWTWEFDLDTDSGSPIALGDDRIGGFGWGSPAGVISGGQDLLLGGSLAFTDTVDDPAATNYGDEKLGSIGNNRAGHRGCYFNDLDLEAGDTQGTTAADRLVRSPRPVDDDCDNDYDLVDGCPGLCGVDDDGNGAVDDIFEVCPCRVCEAGSPRAGQACRSTSDCNIASTTSYLCIDNTDANGVPIAFGDDICGDGQVDENVLADVGTGAGLRQLRNAGISLLNGVGGGGFPNGDPRYNTMDDVWGPTGQSWAGELGFHVFEPLGENTTQPAYGMGIDDMVIEWIETKPIDDTAAVCNTGTNPDFDGQCASLALGVAFNTNDGDGAIPVTVVDKNAATTANAVDCNGDGTAAEIEIRAYSEAERTPEIFCLEPTSPGSAQYKGLIRTTTRIRTPGDKLVYLAWNGGDTPSIVAQYIDKDDGVHSTNNGPDGQPGIAGFDDDGDGTIDNPEELCPVRTNLAPGRKPHLPGQPALFSDDECGCVDNPVSDATFAAFDSADILFVDYTIDDPPSGGGDNDGWPDPGEEVTLNVRIRNMGDFALENVELVLLTDSETVDCVTDDRAIIPRLERHNVAGDEASTADFGDSFTFVVASGVNRQSVGEKFGSEWTLAIRALGKGEPGGSLKIDTPIFGSQLVQSFFIPHNLDATGDPGTPTEFLDDFESYANDDDLRANWVPYVTGDDLEELDGTRCQLKDPANLQGANSAPEFFCALGEGFDNTEEHWHLNGPAPAFGTNCFDTNGCPDGGRSMPGGQASLSNSNTREAQPGSRGDGFTIDLNRMNWVQYKNNFELGLGNPELEYWTQLSVLDSRSLSGGGTFAFDAALVYVCVDKNDNNECDTGQVGAKLDNGERWEPVRAYFSPEQNLRLNSTINCMYDPSDDGSTEDDLFENAFRVGPSSTCFPGNPVDTCVGRTREPDTADGSVGNVMGSFCWPETGAEDKEIGVAGATVGSGPGVWVRRAYKLDRFRGQKILVRFHLSPGAVSGIENLAQVGGPLFGNRDDGWFIDNVRLTGLASQTSTLALQLDNTGSSTICGGVVNCTAVDGSLAVLSYPRNDREGNPKPALFCSDQNTDECDYDGDGTIDSTATDVQSDAPGRAFVLDAQFSSSDKCLGGALEYRYTDLTNNVVIRDWLTDPVTLINPTTTTSYRLETRCSTSLTCSDLVDVTVVVPGSAPTTCRTADLTIAADKQTITWAADANAACTAVFDTLRGDVPTFSSGTCIENDGTDTTTVDTDPAPAAGNAYWYLSRHDADTYSTGAAGEQDRSGITGCP